MERGTQKKSCLLSCSVRIYLEIIFSQRFSAPMVRESDKFVLLGALKIQGIIKYAFSIIQSKLSAASRGELRFLRNNIIQYSLAYPAASYENALATEFKKSRIRW